MNDHDFDFGLDEVLAMAVPPVVGGLKFQKSQLELALKAALGAILVVVIGLLSKSAWYAVAGIAPLFPTFAIVAHVTMHRHKERTRDDLVSSVDTGLGALPVYLAYVLTVYLAVGYFSLGMSILASLLLWATSAIALVGFRKSAKHGLVWAVPTLVALFGGLVLTQHYGVGDPPVALQAGNWVSRWLSNPMAKPLIGAGVVVGLQWLANRKSLSYLTGLLPLFPTFGYIACILVGIERGGLELREMLLFSGASLPVYASYLLGLKLSLRKGLPFYKSLGIGLSAWAVSASILFALWY